MWRSEGVETITYCSSQAKEWGREVESVVAKENQAFVQQMYVMDGW